MGATGATGSSAPGATPSRGQRPRAPTPAPRPGRSGSSAGPESLALARRLVARLRFGRFVGRPGGRAVLAVGGLELDADLLALDRHDLLHVLGHDVLLQARLAGHAPARADVHLFLGADHLGALAVARRLGLALALALALAGVGRGRLGHPRGVREGRLIVVAVVAATAHAVVAVEQVLLLRAQLRVGVDARRVLHRVLV